MTLFDPGPAEVPDPPERISADRRRTLRRKADLAAGIHPATGLKLTGDGRTCADCPHSGRYHGPTRSYWKCRVAGITGGPGTDIRIGWPACTSIDQEARH